MNYFEKFYPLSTLEVGDKFLFFYEDDGLGVYVNEVVSFDGDYALIRILSNGQTFHCSVSSFVHRVF